MLAVGLVAAAAIALLVAQHLYLRTRLSQQEQIQGRLRASEAKFSGILSIAADAIITVNQTGRIVHFNHGAEEIFGYAAPEMIGRHLAMLLPPRFRESHDTHIKDFARSPITSRRMGERREIFAVRQDGTEFPAEASISKLVEPDGILYTVVLRDITKQKRTEEDERFLSTAANELGQTLAEEASIRATVDLPIPRLADACVLDLVGPADVYRRFTSLRHAPELTEPLARIEALPLIKDSPAPMVDVIRRNRHELIDDVDDDWIESNIDPDAIPHWRALGVRSLLILPLHAAGETIGALTLIRTSGNFDDDERRAVAEQFARSAASALANARLYSSARDANHARDEVLGVVSHDLRNPISAIVMCARVLKDTRADETEERAELLQTIEESTRWVNRMIDDLLDVANIERGQLSLELSRQDPAQLALQALHLFEPDAEQQSIALEARLATNLPLVSADGARVVQVLSNLLRNAMKFTRTGGRVTVAAEARDGSVIFSVTDTGDGIPRDAQHKIFDRYWQTRAGQRARGGGLGLPIARGIVDMHGGRIGVESEIGQGSTFWFTIPQAASAMLAGSA